MEPTPVPLQKFSTKDVTPEYRNLVFEILGMLKARTCGPVEGLSILTTVMVTINHESGGGTSLAKFAEDAKRNIINTIVVEKGTMQ